jgi:crossover junction endodeoxyribonuclease RuvC
VTVLALDLAKATGWAAGKPCSPPVYGTIRLDGSDAVRFIHLARTVQRLIVEHDVTDVVLEAPFIGGKLQQSALMPLFGYRAAAMIGAMAKGIEPTSAEASRVRKHFIGAGGLKRQAVKAAVIEKCRWRGWSPRNDNEADALALWDYRCAVLDPQHLVLSFKRG